MRNIAKRIWSTDPTQIEAEDYDCAFCGSHVGSAIGYALIFQPMNKYEFIRICPRCGRPTYFALEQPFVTPAPLPGRPVEGVPPEIQQLFNEARRSSAAGACTAAVMVCRKLLMHIGVEKGGPANGTFQAQVEHLSNTGWIPPGGKGWVDYIRKRGNEANHEIVLMTPADATGLIELVEILLRIIYEMPSKIPPTP